MQMPVTHTKQTAHTVFHFNHSLTKMGYDCCFKAPWRVFTSSAPVQLFVVNVLLLSLYEHG
jgi:hypothetical protein